MFYTRWVKHEKNMFYTRCVKHEKNMFYTRWVKHEKNMFYTNIYLTICIMTDSLPSLQERYQQALDNISSLQSQENEMYESLNDVNLSTAQKDQIINKINEIAQMRSNIYSSMNDTYGFYSDLSASSQKTLGQELDAIKIVDIGLEESRRKLSLLQSERINKIHTAEINTYYSNRFKAHTSVMKNIVVMCLVIFILSVLAKKGILSSNFHVFFTGIVVIIGTFRIGRQLIDLSNRDSMNWDEYNWYFDKSAAPSDTNSTDSTDPWADGSYTCVGQACCYVGSTYNADSNQCVPDKST
jgi:hypothetical protein